MFTNLTVVPHIDSKTLNGGESSLFWIQCSLSVRLKIHVRFQYITLWAPLYNPPRACVSFLWVPWLLPTVHIHAGWVIWWLSTVPRCEYECEWLSVSMYHPVIDWRPVHGVPFLSPTVRGDWLQPTTTVWRISGIDNGRMIRYGFMLLSLSCSDFSRLVFKSLCYVLTLVRFLLLCLFKICWMTTGTKLQLCCYCGK